MYNPNILAVAGNCDFPVVETYLKHANIDIHRKIIRFDKYVIAGISGSLPCPGTTWLDELSTQIKDDEPFIFVPHQPPSETLNDEVKKGMHVGSQAIRRFIQKTSPILCLTGHIHEGIGVDKINDCPIINPGPFRTGKYAQIEIAGESEVRITLKQITAN